VTYFNSRWSPDIEDVEKEEGEIPELISKNAGLVIDKNIFQNNVLKPNVSYMIKLGILHNFALVNLLT